MFKLDYTSSLNCRSVASQTDDTGINNQRSINKIYLSISGGHVASETIIAAVSDIFALISNLSSNAFA